VNERTTPQGRIFVLLAGAAAICLVPSLARAQSPGLMTRASVSTAGIDGNQGSSRGVVSGDGRFIAFESAATNLVPGDNNDDSDVFVHDSTTGVLERVSVTWNGMEARDDSTCPAISADGRYVAFLSRAWNMYPGGANLGRPRADVYLHDRQTHVTTRVTTPLDGGALDGDSDCPSISADGRRVAFGSAANKLVHGDTGSGFDVFLYDADKKKIKLISRTADDRTATGQSWSARISADGTAVAFLSTAHDLDGASLPPSDLTRAFVRDLTTGTTEVVDVTPLQPGDQPDESSIGVALSGDGRIVAFVSHATNLVAGGPALPPYYSNVYVRDRNAAKTILASSPDFLLGDCAEGPETGVCLSGSAVLPSVSADGRWVSFTSYSQRLMPLTYWYTSQAYLFDLLGHRLRRVSLSPDAWETDCSGDSSLSADGSVMAITGSAGLLPQLTAGRHVYRQELQRVPDGRRRPLAACPAQPAECTPAQSAVFRLRRSAPRGTHDSRLFWRWSGAPGATPLPDPVQGARYQLCVYDGAHIAVAMDVGTPIAGSCPDGAKACWEGRGKHRSLRDPRGALSPVTLHDGSGATRILVRGRGPLLDAPYLPRPAAGGLTVQLQDASSGRCWGANFPAGAIEKNFGGTLVLRNASDGWLVARLP
jgi:Tol biopolymer transport system component